METPRNIHLLRNEKKAIFAYRSKGWYSSNGYGHLMGRKIPPSPPLTLDEYLPISIRVDHRCFLGNYFLPFKMKRIVDNKGYAVFFWNGSLLISPWLPMDLEGGFVSFFCHEYPSKKHPVLGPSKAREKPLSAFENRPHFDPHLRWNPFNSRMEISTIGMNPP